MWLIGLFGVLVDPIVVVSSMLVGALAWRWWHLIPGSLVAPIAYWVVYKESFGENDAIMVLPVIAIFGSIWSIVTQSARRHLTS